MQTKYQLRKSPVGLTTALSLSSATVLWRFLEFPVQNEKKKRKVLIISGNFQSLRGKVDWHWPPSISLNLRTWALKSLFYTHSMHIISLLHEKPQNYPSEYSFWYFSRRMESSKKSFVIFKHPFTFSHAVDVLEREQSRESWVTKPYLWITCIL